MEWKKRHYAAVLIFGLATTFTGTTGIGVAGFIGSMVGSFIGAAILVFMVGSLAQYTVGYFESEPSD